MVVKFHFCISLFIVKHLRVIIENFIGTLIWLMKYFWTNFGVLSFLRKLFT